MSKVKRKTSKQKATPKKKLPFWLQIVIIIVIGVIISGVVFFVVSAIKNNKKNDEAQSNAEKHTVTFAERMEQSLKRKPFPTEKVYFPPSVRRIWYFAVGAARSTM